VGEGKEEVLGGLGEGGERPGEGSDGPFFFSFHLGSWMSLLTPRVES